MAPLAGPPLREQLSLAEAGRYQGGSPGEGWLRGAWREELPWQSQRGPQRWLGSRRLLPAQNWMRNKEAGLSWRRHAAHLPPTWCQADHHRVLRPGRSEPNEDFLGVQVII